MDFWEILQMIFLALLALVVSFVLLLIGREFVIVGKKMNLKYKATRFIKDKQKDIVLYLRSFDADKLTAQTTTIDYKGVEIPSFTTEEENLEWAVNKIGTFIALSKPWSKLPDLGALRMPPFKKSEWETEVIRLMDESKLILFRLGKTEALMWELETAMKTIDLNKIVFLIPRNYKIYKTVATKIKEWTNIVLPRYVGSRDNPTSINGVIYFKNNLPVYLPLADAEYRESSTTPLFPKLRITLRPIFENIGAKWTPPPVPYKLYLWFLAYLWLTGLCVTWLVVLFLDGADPISLLISLFKEFEWFKILFIFIFVYALCYPLYLGVTGLLVYWEKLNLARKQFK